MDAYGNHQGRIQQRQRIHPKLGQNSPPGGNNGKQNRQPLADVLSLRPIVQRQNKWSILVSSDLRLLGEIINRGASLGKTMAGSSGIEPQGVGSSTLPGVLSTGPACQRALLPPEITARSIDRAVIVSTLRKFTAVVCLINAGRLTHSVTREAILVYVTRVVRIQRRGLFLTCGTNYHQTNKTPCRS